MEGLCTITSYAGINPSLSLRGRRRKEITPFSDLEFCIFIAEDNEFYKQYFQDLTNLLHIKIVNLGETILPALGIQSLNGSSTEDPMESLFYDSVTMKGFTFDGILKGACKIPFGNTALFQGMAIKSSKNQNYFELIHTPENMLKP